MIVEVIIILLLLINLLKFIFIIFLIYRLVGNFDYAVSQLWGQKEKNESLKLNPSKKARAVKGWDKVNNILD